MPDDLRRIGPEGPGLAVTYRQQVGAVHRPLVVRKACRRTIAMPARWLLRGRAQWPPHSWPTSVTSRAPRGTWSSACSLAAWPFAAIARLRSLRRFGPDRRRARSRRAPAPSADRSRRGSGWRARPIAQHVRREPHVGIGRAEHGPGQQHEAGEQDQGREGQVAGEGQARLNTQRREQGHQGTDARSHVEHRQRSRSAE